MAPPMRKLLLQLDSSRLPSVFDQVVAYDAAADVVMSYGGGNEGGGRDPISRCLFSPGPQDIPKTPAWVGGDKIFSRGQLPPKAPQHPRRMDGWQQHVCR